MAAIIRCKMCGGDLILTPNSTVAECESCGTVQTVPSADNEKKLIQFERAERLRKNCEFDKAASVYESIIAEFRQEAEAYWGLVLCKYGIEYVDDPATGKKVPTCHRTSFDSIMDDANFEQTLENADVVSRKVYREEAKQIEEIRKGIVEVSSKEEPYDIFICYKETDEKGERTLDSVIAQDMYTTLTEKGYRVFFSRITLEDKLGQEYEPYIFAALNSAKVMLAVGTDYEYYNAVWVKNEWSRFLKLIEAGQKKTLIPCYKNIDAYDMPKEFAKLQAQDMGKVGAMQDLLRGIEKLLEEKKSAPAKATVDSADLNKSYVYNTAIEKGNSKKIANVKEGIKALESISGWQDADSQKLVLEEKLKKLKKKRTIKRIVTLGIIVAIIGGIALSISMKETAKKRAYYEQAVEYLEMGAYYNANQMFIAANGYEDADTYVNDAEFQNKVSASEKMASTVCPTGYQSWLPESVLNVTDENYSMLDQNLRMMESGELFLQISVNSEDVQTGEKRYSLYINSNSYDGQLIPVLDSSQFIFKCNDGQQFVLKYQEEQLTILEGPEGVEESFCVGWRAVDIVETNARKLMKINNGEYFDYYLSFGVEMICMTSSELGDEELIIYAQEELYNKLSDEFYN